MITRTCGILAHAVAALCVLSCASAAPGAERAYWPEVMFSVRYGPAAHEAKYVTAIRAPAEDMLFVADTAQDCVKRFSAEGVVEAVVDRVPVRLDVEGQPEVLRPLGFVHDIAATPDGRVFLAVGPGPAVHAFSPSGAAEAGSRDKILAELRAHVPYLATRPEVFNVAADAHGFVYLYVSPAPNEYNVALAKLGPDLTFVGVAPGCSVGSDGRTYGFAPNKEPEPNHMVRVWSPSGELERTIRLSPPPELSEGDYDAATGQWRAISGFFADSAGEVYMVLTARRPRSEWVLLRPDFKIIDDIVIYKFDREGSFLLKLVVDGLPYGMDLEPPVAVDPEGNIYHLEYYEDRVDFVKEVLAWEEEVAGASSGPERVGLREALEPLGWLVGWNPRTRTARAARGRRTVEVCVGKRWAVVNGQRAPLSEEVGLESGRVRVPSGFARQVGAREQGPGPFARLAKLAAEP